MTSSASAQQPAEPIRTNPATLWILHREDAVRRGLAARLRIEGALLGDPRDAGPEDPAAPRAIVLGVSGDFEAELELVSRLEQRAPELEWMVVARGEDLAEARRLFDTLPGRVVDLAGDAAALRALVLSSLSKRQAPPLSERHRRRKLTERFTRWHADAASPALLAATDPRRVGIPVWIRGEAGTGRGVLARYLHQLATGVPAGPFVSVACEAALDREGLLSAWRVESGELPSGLLTTVCFEQVDRLTPALQIELAGWIEYGAPPGFVPSARQRFIAISEGPVHPRLAESVAGLEVELPALREDTAGIGDRARILVEAWCREHDVPARSLSEEAIARLTAHGWPGNLRELETVLARSLAASPGRELGWEALRLSGESAERPEDGAERGEAALDPGASRAAREIDSPGREGSPASPSDTPSFSVEEPADEGELLLRTELEEGDALTSLLDAPEMAGAFTPLDAETGEDTVFATEDPFTADNGDEADVHSDPLAPPALRPPTARGAQSVALRRLAGALAHEIGNPLVGLRSFAQMLPRRFEDPEFRRVAAERVAADTARIETVLETLARLAPADDDPVETIDLSALLGGLLAERRGRIADRHLVVLEELDRETAVAVAPREALRGALVSLLDAVFELLPDRGDLYVATQGPSPSDPPGARTTRALIRFTGADGAAPDGLARAEQSVGLAAAGLALEAIDGTLVLDTRDAPTTLVLFDLPADASL